MLIFDHIGILAKDVDAAAVEFGGAIDAVEATVRFDDPGLTVSVRFLRDRSGVVYELIAPTISPQPSALNVCTGGNRSISVTSGAECIICES